MAAPSWARANPTSARVRDPKAARLFHVVLQLLRSPACGPSSDLPEEEHGEEKDQRGHRAGQTCVARNRAATTARIGRPV